MKQRKEHPVAHLSDPGKKALLQLCYQTVREIGPKHGTYDPMAQAAVAEALTDKMVEFVKGQPSKTVMAFTVSDANTYDYFCDVLDSLQQTLPWMDHFNVVLHMERVNTRGGFSTCHHNC
jgi:hypothetical protein